MATKEEVEKFLNRFYEKTRVFDIYFRDDRSKNMQALAELGITARKRKEIVLDINSLDFVEGPIADTLNNINDMWVFGKDVNNKDVYIKISLGYQSGSTICISFHVAEKRIEYKFK